VISCECSESDDDVSKMVWRRKAVWKSGAGTWCHCNTQRRYRNGESRRSLVESSPRSRPRWASTVAAVSRLKTFFGPAAAAGAGKASKPDSDRQGQTGAAATGRPEPKETTGARRSTAGQTPSPLTLPAAAAAAHIPGTEEKEARRARGPNEPPGKPQSSLASC
jgi:hypothetical protein